MPTGADRAAPGLRERKKAQTRAAIQTCALRLFREQGYGATTVEQILAAANVSESTFYRYFPLKEDLVLRDDFDPRIIAAYEAQPPGTPPLRAARNAFAAAFAGLTGEQRDEQRQRIALILAVPELRAKTLDQFSQAMQLLADAIAARAGRRRDDFAVRTLAGAIVGVMMAVLAEMADDPGADLAALIDRAIGQLEAGWSL